MKLFWQQADIQTVKIKKIADFIVEE